MFLLAWKKANCCVVNCQGEKWSPVADRPQMMAREETGISVISVLQPQRAEFGQQPE